MSGAVVTQGLRQCLQHSLGAAHAQCVGLQDVPSPSSAGLQCQRLRMVVCNLAVERVIIIL